MPFPWRHGQGVELAEVFARPETFLEQKAVIPALHGDGIGLVGLELDRIGSGLGCPVDQFDGLVQVSAMIARELGHDEWRDAWVAQLGKQVHRRERTG